MHSQEYGVSNSSSANLQQFYGLCGAREGQNAQNAADEAGVYRHPSAEGTGASLPEREAICTNNGKRGTP